MFQHFPSRPSARRASALIASGVVVGAVVLAGFAPTQAAPGSPGVPADPEVLLAEGFGVGQTSGNVSELADYDGGKYTADPSWLDATAGNGIVMDSHNTNADLTALGYASATNGPAGFTNGDRLREISEKIGELNGSAEPDKNFAVSAYTDKTPSAADKVEFRTKTPVNLDADGRFLTISANVGVNNCQASHPQMVFYLDDAGTETRVNDTALDPCPAGAAAETAYATNLVGGKAALFTGDQVGIIMRNENSSGGGNDHAFDDIKVLDATPQLDKVFADEGDTLSPGDVTDLVLTVTNTSELGEKTGWSFTDHLPKGLKVAGTGTSTCAAGTLTADEGDTTVELAAGSLAAGSASCEITVPVTSSTGGVFENSAKNITSVGLNAPGATQIEYVAPEVEPTDDVAAGDLDAPETGAQHASTWQPVAALAVGLVLLLGLGVRTVVARRRN